MSLSCDKLICVGKNYLDHAKELGDAVPEKPVLFMKPPSACVSLERASANEPQDVVIPWDRGEIHHEAEIVLRLDSRARIEAVTLGLDLTLRELQAQLKKAGHPWEMAKAFPRSALIGPWISLSDFQDYLSTPFSFSLDGQVVQTARGSEMRFSPEQCIAYAAEHFELRPGDLLFTGTPAGVGPLRHGQIGQLKWGSHLKAQVRFV
jgi:2-keto-4-pentenoate hydratase/2-oxohepta-3-ene-1,7-dioic acid hydratase in catechol pathway